MLNLEQWKNDANARKELDELLHKSILANAIEIVKDQGCPTTACPVNVNLIHYSALTGAWKEGYREAIDNLLQLAKTTAHKRVVMKPWTVDPKSIPEEKFTDPPEGKLVDLNEKPKTEPVLTTTPQPTP